MESRECIRDDISAINALFDGGMPIASKNLLFAVVEDYRDERDGLYQVGIRYLVEVLLPKIKGRDEVSVASDIRLQLFGDEIEMDWNEWLLYFPGTSIEIFEDKQSGRNKSVTQEQLNAISLDDFYSSKTGLFYSPNGFFDFPAPGRKRRRTQNNVKCINAFFIDLDGAGTKELKTIQRRAIAQSVLEPSFVVETKNGFHVIWLLEPGYDDQSSVRWKNIQKALIRSFKSDAACSDVSRLLRMPDSWHCKDLWKGGEAFKVKVVYQSTARYWMDDFHMFEHKQKRTVRKFKPQEGKLILPPIASLSVGNRHAAMKEEAARTYALLGTSVELAPQARQAMKDWYRLSCIELKPNWEKEVDDYCDWLELNQFN